MNQPQPAEILQSVFGYRDLPPLPGGDRRHPGRRRGCLRADADRRRQVPLLPDPGAVPTGGGDRRLAADLADEGPGRRPGRQRRARRFLQLLSHRRRGPPGPGQTPCRGTRPALPRPGAADERGVPGAAGRDPHCPVRHRRGALRLPVGARLPSRVHPARPAAPGFSPGAAAGADRHRRSPDPRRHPRPPAAAPGQSLRRRLRPPQHPLQRRRQAEALRPAAGLFKRAARRGGDRLRALPQAGRGGGGEAGGNGAQGRRLPRRAP